MPLAKGEQSIGRPALSTGVPGLDESLRGGLSPEVARLVESEGVGVCDPLTRSRGFVRETPEMGPKDAERLNA